MEETRARELITRKFEFQKALSALIDEYADVMRPGCSRAVDWYHTNECLKTSTDDDKLRADMMLSEADEEKWASFEPYAWVLAVELSDVQQLMEIGERFVSQRFLCEPSMSASHVEGLHLTAAGVT